jgi:hypothetical protein
MQATGLLGASESTSAKGAVSVSGTPWFCRGVVFAGFCILVGIVWDISWHSAIGRDTFWTPAHICIHFGGTLGGLICGWLVLKATFWPSPEDRATSVNVCGMRGPLGAWVTIWGALAMLTSAPFDNWWHNAYGLDVEILSPPHSVLAAGMYFHVVGGLLLVLGVQNRSADADQTRGRWLFAFAGGILLSMAAIMVTEKSLPNQQHAALFYKICGGLYPFFLVALARASKLPWPATTVAGIYMGLMCTAVWILPLFPAQPKLAPIYNPIKNMVPPMFPLLMIFPAFAMDVIFRALGKGRGWKRDFILVLLLATAFLGLFTAVQWEFSKFLISLEAKNWFFAGGGFFTFADMPNEWWNKFWRVDLDPVNGSTLFFGWLLAVISSAAGLSLGNWMARVQR